MRRLILLSVFALTACSHAPQPAVPVAPAALAAQANQAMRQPMRTLMDRCFTIMTRDYGTASIGTKELQAYADLAPEQAAAHLKAMDLDHDGHVSRAELITWGQRPGGLAAMQDAVITPAFRHADQDGDTQLSPGEAEHAVLSLGAQSWPLGITAADAKAADHDGDGLLSAKEFAPLAAAKTHAGLFADEQLPRHMASIVFKAIPWSH